MDLSKILTISGKPGLYLLKTQGKNSMIVDSIVDGKTMPAFAHDKMSSLDDICIFTTSEDRPLKEVFMSIHEKMGDTLDFNPKDIQSADLKEKFKVVLPDYDEMSVYPSDMKKVFQWYQLLNDKKLLDFTEEKDVESADKKNNE